MTPHEKLLAAIFGHTQESAAYIAGEKAEKLTRAWVRATEMARVASLDPWAAAMGVWTPVLHWDEPAAYCAAVEKVVAWASGTSKLEVFGLFAADLEEITHKETS